MTLTRKQISANLVDKVAKLCPAESALRESYPVGTRVLVHPLNVLRCYEARVCGYRGTMLWVQDQSGVRRRVMAASVRKIRRGTAWMRK